jgi:hypothetical protein
MGAVTKPSGTLDDFEMSAALALIDGFHAELKREGMRMMLPRLPTLAERQKISSYIETLHRRLRPISASVAEKEKAAQAIAGMLTGWLGQMRNVDVDALVAAHVTHLLETPLFAILAACDDIRLGRVSGLDPDFPPSSTRILKAALPHVEKVGADQYRAKLILGVSHLLPRQLSKEEHERVKAKMADLAFTLPAIDPMIESEQRARAAVAKRSVEETRKMILRDWAHHGEQPPEGTVLISRELRNKLRR